MKKGSGGKEPEYKAFLLRLRKEMEDSTPESWDKIRRRLGRQSPAAARAPRRFRTVAAAAACLALCVAVAMGTPALWHSLQGRLAAASGDAESGRYLFTVFSPAADSGLAGDTAALPGEPKIMLSSDGYNQLGAIGQPWETDGGSEYRLDVELNFAFWGKELESVAYTCSGSDGTLLLRHSTEGETAAAARLLREEDAQGEWSEMEMDICELTAQEQTDPALSLWLRLRVDAAPYEGMDALEALSGVYDAFREEICRTRLTALLEYGDGEREAVALQLGLAQENDHAVTVTLLTGMPAG